MPQVPDTAVYSGRSPSEVFAWMIHPITPAEFFRDYWEKKPLLIRRKKSKYYKDVCGRGSSEGGVGQVPGWARPGMLWVSRTPSV